MLKRLIIFFLTAFISLSIFSLPETISAAGFNATEANRTLDKLIARSSNEKPTIKHYQRLINQVNALQIKAKKCITDNTMELDKVNKRLNESQILTGKETTVTAERKYLENKKNDLNSQLSACRLFVLKSDELLNQYSSTMQQLVAKQLLRAESNIFSNLHQTPSLIGELTHNFEFIPFSEDMGLDIFETTPTIILIVLLIITLLASLKIRQIAKRKIANGFSNTLPGRTKEALLYLVKRYIVPLFLLTTFCIFSIAATYHNDSSFHLTYLAISALIFVAYLFVVEFFFHPPKPAKSFSDLPPHIAKVLSRRLKALGLLSFIGFAYYIIFSGLSIPTELHQLTRTIFITLLAINLIVVIAVVNKLPRLVYHFTILRHFIGIVLIAASALIVIAEWLGYHGIATYILRGIVITLLAGFVAWLLTKLVKATGQSKNQPAYQWQQKLRHYLGLKDAATWPEIVWVRAVFYLIIWGFFLLMLLRGWGLDFAYFKNIVNSLLHGFEVAGMVIVPSRILIAFFIFITLCILTRLFRARITQKQSSRIEYGSREALASIIGYLGFAISLLFGLLIAGVNFAGLAIIAGALSVGIGFGLQNIVNNFISGIILLVEQPIKTGDRIIVSNTEGIIERISIRSTRVKTPSGTDVIVPNSELITQQVTNLMFHDPHFQIKNYAGVTYGTDIELVRKLLFEVAYNNPDVINHIPEKAPLVFLSAFGDSSINFTLLCFIRDVNTSGRVISDINFAIAKIFAAHGVHFAYPHRDVTVLNWPNLDKQKNRP